MSDNKCIRIFADVEQIAHCKQRMTEISETVEQLANALSLAGNSVRLSILLLIYEEGKLCPCDLSDVLDMKIPAISQHLRKLKDGGILQTERDGQTIYYSFNQEYMELLQPVFSHIPQSQNLVATL
jgi:DNA-binding transcriptional ArsR family regulator